MSSVSATRRILCRIAALAVVCCLAGLAPAARAQQPDGNLSVARQEWFFEQRRYGLGHIPEDALAKAVAQRDAGTTAAKSSLASDGARAITEGQWISLGPAGINSTQNDLVSGRGQIDRCRIAITARASIAPRTAGETGLGSTRTIFFLPPPP